VYGLQFCEHLFRCELRYVVSTLSAPRTILCPFCTCSFLKCFCQHYIVHGSWSWTLGWHVWSSFLVSFLQHNSTASTRRLVSKIFRTDAVKIIKITIRPIGRHQPRGNSFPRVDTGPSVTSIFGTPKCQALLPFGLDLLNGIKPASFQLQFQFWK
jgi:hypothetical protein